MMTLCGIRCVNSILTGNVPSVGGVCHCWSEKDCGLQRGRSSSELLAEA